MTECDQDASPEPRALIDLARAIEQDLLDRHGPLIADEALRVALGYRSMEAFRQAMSRKTLPVPVFSLPNRRGKYALVKDIAHWLAALRFEVSASSLIRGDDRAQSG